MSESINGSTVEQPSLAQVEAEQTSSPTSHVGTPTATFAFYYNSAVVTFTANVPFIADVGLYNALGGAGAANITWSN